MPEQMAWCDVPVVVSKLHLGRGGSKYVGVLAIICGDGVCRVLLLPAPSLPRSDSDPSCEAPIVTSRTLRRFTLTAPVPTAGGRDWLTSVAWQPSLASPQKEEEGSGSAQGESVRIACGLSSGGVLVWSLPLRHFWEDEEATGASPALFSAPMCRSLSPSLSLRDLLLRRPGAAAKCAVTTLQFCPYNPHLLLCAGYEGTIKVGVCRCVAACSCTCACAH